MNNEKGCQVIRIGDSVKVVRWSPTAMVQDMIGKVGVVLEVYDDSVCVEFKKDFALYIGFELIEKV